MHLLWNRDSPAFTEAIEALASGISKRGTTSSPSGRHFLRRLWNSSSGAVAWLCHVHSVAGGQEVAVPLASLSISERAHGSSKVGGSWRPYASLPRFLTGGDQRGVFLLFLPSEDKHPRLFLQHPHLQPPQTPPPTPPTRSFFLFLPSFLSFSSPPAYSAFNVIIRAALAAVRDVG